MGDVERKYHSRPVFSQEDGPLSHVGGTTLPGTFQTHLHSSIREHPKEA